MRAQGLVDFMSSVWVLNVLPLSQVPAAAVQGSRNFHFSVYGKKSNAKVADDVSSSFLLMKVIMSPKKKKKGKIKKKVLCSICDAPFFFNYYY